MPSNLLRRVRGPALIHYRGLTFYAQDAIAFEPQLQPFAVKSDAYGMVGSRFGGRVIKVSFTPVGAWSAAALAILYPFALYQAGQFNTPRLLVSAVNTGTSAVTVTAHGTISGTGFRVASTAILPTGFAVNTTYYANVVDPNTLKFYDTEAHAIAGGATGLIALSTTGTGTIRIIQNTPLLINWFDGTLLTVWNAAITKMPSLNLSAVKTPFGAVEFEGYSLHGQQWSDNNSLFTLGVQAVTDATFDPTQIPTVPYSAQFGVTAPFSDLQPRDGVQVDFTMETEDVRSDSDGVLCKAIKDISAMAKIRPLNLTEGDLLGEVLLQGAGAAMGAELPSADLLIFGPGNNPYVHLFGARFQNAPLKAGAQEDRVDVINFKTARTFIAGVSNPVFYVGTIAG
jgi:hypothetical protein